MKSHALELVGAILLCLAAYLAYAVRVPISAPPIGTGAVAASSPDAWSFDLLASPKLRITWPQFPNFCVGLCTREEYLQ